MILKLSSIICLATLWAACSPRFNTTPNPADQFEIEKNNKIKSIYGTWNYHFENKTLRYDMQLIISDTQTQVTTKCFNGELETSIRSVSHTKVEVGSIAFIDGITGTIKTGTLECGIDFPAASYSASVQGDILTIVTQSGPMGFRHAGPTN